MLKMYTMEIIVLTTHIENGMMLVTKFNFLGVTIEVEEGKVVEEPTIIKSGRGRNVFN